MRTAFFAVSHAFFWLTLAGGTHALFIMIFYRNMVGQSSAVLDLWVLCGQINVQIRRVTVTFPHLCAGMEAAKGRKRGSSLLFILWQICNSDFRAITPSFFT